MGKNIIIDDDDDDDGEEEDSNIKLRIWNNNGNVKILESK